jgi:hypothetical protein
MVYNQTMEFYNWMTRKYLEWRGDAIGREKSITQFAKYIGVSQQLMTEWLREGGNIPRDKKKINKLVEKYGDEVFVVLGLVTPEIGARIEKLREDYYASTDKDGRLKLVEDFFSEIGVNSNR